MTKCDFCSSPETAWVYPCGDFSVLFLDEEAPAATKSMSWNSTSSWIACEECSALVEVGDWDTLADRGLMLLPDLGDEIIGEVKKAVLHMHQEGFVKQRQGKRESLDR